MRHQFFKTYYCQHRTNIIWLLFAITFSFFNVIAEAQSKFKDRFSINLVSEYYCIPAKNFVFMQPFDRKNANDNIDKLLERKPTYYISDLLRPDKVNVIEIGINAQYRFYKYAEVTFGYSLHHEGILIEEQYHSPDDRPVFPLIKYYADYSRIPVGLNFVSDKGLVKFKTGAGVCFDILEREKVYFSRGGSVKHTDIHFFERIVPYAGAELSIKINNNWSIMSSVKLNFRSSLQHARRTFYFKYFSYGIGTGISYRF